MKERLAADSPFDTMLGTEWLEMTPELARARVKVKPELLQPLGLVHGGVYASIAESLTSEATWRAVSGDGMIVMGQNNDLSLLRPITEGFVNATARSRHRGRTTWVWEVEITDDDERLCALVRMTIAVRPSPDGR